MKRDFDYFACTQCEFLFVEPFLAPEEIYTDDYYEGRGPDPYVRYSTEFENYRRLDRVLEFDDLARVAQKYLETQPPAGPIKWLDFGCGAGGFLKYLVDKKTFSVRGKDFPIEIVGNDVGAYAERLKKENGFNIVNDSELAAFKDATFDMISMIEVLEHIPMPAEPLKLIARLLKPGGLLILTTGNLGSPIAKRQGLNYAYNVPEIHISLFNPRSLAFLYAHCGLSPYFVRYHDVVKYKGIKTVLNPTLKRLARIALAVPGTVSLVDLLYGVSAMPCAVKPLRGDESSPAV